MENIIVFFVCEKESLEFLIEVICKEFFVSYEKVIFLILFEVGNVVVYLNDYVDVLVIEYLENGM